MVSTDSIIQEMMTLAEDGNTNITDGKGKTISCHLPDMIKIGPPNSYSETFDGKCKCQINACVTEVHIALAYCKSRNNCGTLAFADFG